MAHPEARLKAFYDLRAAEEPDVDPEAAVRFRKALRAANLTSGERLLDIGSKWGGLGACARARAGLHRARPQRGERPEGRRTRTGRAHGRRLSPAPGRRRPI